MPSENQDVKINVGFDVREQELYNKVANAAARIKPIDIRFKTQQNNPLGHISRSADEFNKSLAASSARVLAFSATAGQLYLVSKGFSALVKSTVEVQKILADINIITQVSTQRLGKFSDELFDAANKTGQSFDVAGKAALEFARQGLSLEESLKRTRDALSLTRFTGLQVEESILAITTALNTFDDAALDSTKILEKISQIDVSFAVSGRDLAQGLTRVGSIAKDAGVEFDKLLGLITSAKVISGRTGDVVGTALGTIFQRLGRNESLDTLEQLGVLTKNVNGDFLSSDKILQNLSRVYDKLSQAQQNQVTQLVGGVRQGNILRAVLSDLSKENSIYARATLESANASGFASQRNAELNKTLAASINEIQNRFSQLGSSFGNLVIKSPVEKFANVFKQIDEALTSGQPGENAGVNIGTGILKGLSEYISGPGAATAIALATKLFFNFGKFAVQSFGRILENNNKEFQVRSAINNLLVQNTTLNDRLNQGGLSQLQIQESILAALKGQSIEYARQGQIAAAAKALTATGQLRVSGDRLILGKNKAVGHIPEIQEKLGAYAGGYLPGAVKSMPIPKLGNVIYNTAETIKKFPGLEQPAIIPPQNSKAGLNYKKEFTKSHGFDPYKSNGYMPNFANSKDALLKYLSEVNPKYVGLFRGIQSQDTGLAKFLRNSADLRNPKGLAEMGGILKKDLLQFTPSKYGLDTTSYVNLSDSPENIKKRIGDVFGSFDMKSPLGNKGIIPNYSPLNIAVQRERQAGVPLTKIRVGQSPFIKSNLNPLGLGVYNTQDEPLGLNQGINRVASMGLDPKKSGIYFKGNIPNFAPYYKKIPDSSFKDPNPDFRSNSENVKLIEGKDLVDLEKSIKEFKDKIRAGIISQSNFNKSIEDFGKDTGLASQSLQQITKKRLLPSLRQSDPTINASSFGGLNNSQTSTIGNAIFNVRNAGKANRADEFNIENYKRVNESQLVSNGSTGVRELFREQTKFTGIRSGGAGIINTQIDKYLSLIASGAKDSSESMQRFKKEIISNAEQLSYTRKTIDKATGSISTINYGGANAAKVSKILNQASPLASQIQTDEKARTRPFTNLQNFTLSGKVGGLSQQEFTQQFRQLTAAGKSLPEELRQQYLQQVRDLAKQTSVSRELTSLQSSSGKFGGLGSLFGQGKKDFTTLKGANPDAARDITNSLQNKAFLTSIVAPILAGVAQQSIGTETVGKRGAGAIVGGLGNVASFGSTAFALGGGPIGAGLGALIGGLIELPKIIDAFSNTLPDLQKRLGELQDTSQKTSAALAEYIDSSEKLADVYSGKITGLTNSQVNQLKKGQNESLLSIPNVQDRSRISTLIGNNQLEEARNQIGIINQQNTSAVNATAIAAAARKILPDIKTEGNIRAESSVLTSGGKAKISRAGSASRANLGISDITLNTELFNKQINDPRRQKLLDQVIGSASQSALSLPNKEGKSIFDFISKDEKLSSQLSNAKSGELGKEFSLLAASIGGFDIGAIADIADAFKQIENTLGKEGSDKLKANFTKKALDDIVTGNEKFIASNVKSRNAIVLLNKYLDESAQKFADLGTQIQIAGIKNLSQLTSSLKIGEIGQKTGNQISLLRGGGEETKNLFDLRENRLGLQNRAQEQTRTLQVQSGDKTFKVLESYREDLIKGTQDALQTLYKDSPDTLVKRIKEFQANFDEIFVPATEELKRGGTIDEKKVEKFVDLANKQRDFYEKINRLGGVSGGLSEFRKTREADIKNALGDEPGTVNIPFSETNKFVESNFPKTFTTEDKQFLASRSSEELQQLSANGKQAAEASSKLIKSVNGILSDYRTTAQQIQSDLEEGDKVLLQQFNQNVKLIGAQRAVSLENIRRTGSFDIRQSRQQFNLSNSSLGKGFQERINIENQRAFENQSGNLIRSAINDPKFNGLINEKTTASDLSKLLKQQEKRLEEAKSLSTFSDTGEGLTNLTKQKDAYNAIAEKIAEINNLDEERIENIRQQTEEQKKDLLLSEGRLVNINKQNTGLVRNRDFSTLTKKFGQDFSTAQSFTTDDFYDTLRKDNEQFAVEFKQTFKDGFAEAATGAKSFGDALSGIGISLGKSILTKASNLATDQLFGALFGQQSNLTGGAGILSSIFGSLGSNKNGGYISKYAKGGYVNQGSGVKDDVPALLSGGEFVVKKSSTQKIGKSVLDSLNNNPSRLAYGGLIKKYASGGLSTKQLNKLKPEKQLDIINSISSQELSASFSNEYFGEGSRTRPTKGYFNTSSLLSDIALTDENNPQNKLKFDRERYFVDLKAYEKEKKKALNRFNKAQTARRTSAYVSAAINFAGSTIGKANSNYSNYGQLSNPHNASYLTGRALGGLIPKNYAGGGSIFGGDDIRDTIPAMIMGGEYVVNKNSVNRIGKSNLDYMNKTGKVPGFANGGYVGDSGITYGNQNNDLVSKYFNELISISAQIRDNINNKRTNDSSNTNDVSSGINISNTITVNISDSGIKTNTNSQVNNSQDNSNNKDKNNQDKQSQGKALGNMVNDIVKNELVRQSKPGGILYENFKKK